MALRSLFVTSSHMLLTVWTRMFKRVDRRDDNLSWSAESSSIFLCCRIKREASWTPKSFGFVPSFISLRLYTRAMFFRSPSFLSNIDSESGCPHVFSFLADNTSAGVDMHWVLSTGTPMFCFCILREE